MNLRDLWGRYMRRWYPAGRHPTPMLPGLIRLIVIPAVIITLLGIASCSFIGLIFRAGWR